MVRKSPAEKTPPASTLSDVADIILDSTKKTSIDDKINYDCNKDNNSEKTDVEKAYNDSPKTETIYTDDFEEDSVESEKTDNDLLVNYSIQKCSRVTSGKSDKEMPFDIELKDSGRGSSSTKTQEMVEKQVPSPTLPETKGLTPSPKKTPKSPKKSLEPCRQSEQKENLKSSRSKPSIKLPEKRISKGPVKTFSLSNYPAEITKEKQDSENHIEQPKENKTSDKESSKNTKHALSTDKNKLAKITRIPLNKFPIRSRKSISTPNIQGIEENKSIIDTKLPQLSRKKPGLLPKHKETNNIRSELPPIKNSLVANINSQTKQIINESRSKVSAKQSLKTERKDPKPAEKKTPPKPVKKIEKKPDVSSSLPNMNLGPISCMSVDSDHPEFKPLISDEIEVAQEIPESPPKIELPEPKPKVKPKFFTFSSDGNKVVAIKKKLPKEIV